MKYNLFSVAGKVLLSLLPYCLFVSNLSAQSTANDFSSVVSYGGRYSYGVNPGYYGSTWSAENLSVLAMGSSSLSVKGVGAKSLRVPLYDDHLSTYGLTAELSKLQYYASLGAQEMTAFVGSPSPSHRETTTFPGASEPAKTFKGLYEPIWTDASQTQVNPNNTFAQYLYNVVKTYGPYVKFWEVVNEPDFTSGSGGWAGDMNPPMSGSWFERNPSPEELTNLKAPIFYYIRMLKVSWEVIKKLSPSSYVCTGGIGYRSFLDAVLRNTDNPVDGSITSQYPLKGGAYFDVVSFHNYPMYGVKAGTQYQRNSDGAVGAFLLTKENMERLVSSYGYNGSQYPNKVFICTETGVSRTMSGDLWGSNEGQKNYLLKAQVAAQKASISQLYWFCLGDFSGSDQYSQMGLYRYFGNASPYNATASDQGIALKTTSDLLYSKTYDAQRTAALSLPSSVDGAAFRATDGSYTYVLWAKTTADLSETASATYSFPSSVVSQTLSKKEWNFSQTNSSSTINPSSIQLSASPIFLQIQNNGNTAPTANAGADQTITLPTNSVELNGSGTDIDGTITSYSWSQIAGPAQAVITNAGTTKTSVTSLVQGTYQFRLEVTDNSGATGADTVQINVNPTSGSSNIAPVAKAGADQVITLPTNTVQLNGAGTDADGTITLYQWTKVSGPASYSISSPSSASTSITGLAEGVYTFRLTVTDNNGATANDDIQVTVNAVSSPTNIAPVANAGKDITITLPVSKVQLSGTGTDIDGTIVTYQWSMTDGPAGYQITSPSASKTSVTGLVEGTYKFKLTVSDNKGANGYDTVLVLVKPALKTKSTVTVYPSPATTSTINLKIDAVTAKNYSTIIIYNSLGNVVYTEEFMRTEQQMVKQIDISQLDKGTYFINVRADINTDISVEFIKL